MRVMVTGGGHGIGRKAVKLLLEEGKEVVVFEKDEEFLDSLPDSVEKYRGDVADEERVEEVVGKEEFDVLVNNAGYQKMGSLEDMDSDSFERHFRTNVFGPASFIRHSMDMLREKDGRIVNVGSIAGQMSFPYMSGYCGSKFALRAMNDSLRVELRDTEVDVVLVEPGVILTGFNVEGMRGVRDYMEDSFHSESYEGILERAEDLDGASPEKAGETIYRAVTDTNPSKVYRVPWRVWMVPFLEKTLPTSLRDLMLYRRESG